MGEVPELAEFTDDPEWSTVIRTEHVIDAAWQEMAENGVDSAHFRYVHGTAEVPVMQSYDTSEFPYSQMRSSQKFPTPRGVMEGRIASRLVGPGVSVVEFSGIGDTPNPPVHRPITAPH